MGNGIGKKISQYEVNTVQKGKDIWRPSKAPKDKHSGLPIASQIQMKLKEILG